MAEYLIILLGMFVIAFLLKRKFQVTLFTTYKQLFTFYTIFLSIGIIWDHYAIARGHWFFGNSYLLGTNIGYMPIEDYMFIIIMSYFGLVLYRIIEKK